MAETLRQAIVVIHGMGEQRPVETLNGFSQVITPEGANYYSRADKIARSFESRRHLIPAQSLPDDGDIDTQTEIYEYHWAHFMQGNRLDDMWSVFRRILFPAPGWRATLWCLVWIAVAVAGWALWKGPWEAVIPGWAAVGLVAAGIFLGFGYLLAYVPSGLVVVWILVWAAVAWTAWALTDGPLANLGSDRGIVAIGTTILGTGAATLAATYIVSHVLPSWISSSFVDVVRYLDTSPRSYKVRYDIRSGIVDLLQGLHDSQRYQRVVIVAHSLGSYIAYDAICHLWSRLARLHAGQVSEADPTPPGGLTIDGLEDLEAAASSLDAGNRLTAEEHRAALRAYRSAQRTLWAGLRHQGNPWLITDLISFGSPMYFADRLYTRNKKQFQDRIDRHEICTCPPQNELEPLNNINGQDRFFSWNNNGRRVLHDSAPFAVVRWTNLWYPAWIGFFGDWFGGPLAPLYGRGVSDIPLTRNRPWRSVPGYAHALYIKFRRDRRPGAFAGELAEALQLNARAWLAVVHPEPTDRATSGGTPP